MNFRERVENFWYYYKWYVIFGALAIFMIITTIQQVRSRIDYDTTIVFLGSFGQTEDTMRAFQTEQEKQMTDANGDGTVHVLPYFLNITGSALQAEQDSAAVVRLQGMIMTREVSALVVDQSALQALANGGALENLQAYQQAYDLTEESPYGIAIAADNPVFSMFTMSGKQYYFAVIAKKADMNEREQLDFQNAEQLLIRVIEGNQKK